MIAETEKNVLRDYFNKSEYLKPCLDFLSNQNNCPRNTFNRGLQELESFISSNSSHV